MDIFHFSSPELREQIKDRIARTQQVLLQRNNASRQNRTFNVGESVFVRNNKRLGNKLTPLYSEEIVEADLGTTVLIKGRVVHKDNLR